MIVDTVLYVTNDPCFDNCETFYADLLRFAKDSGGLTLIAKHPACNSGYIEALLNTLDRPLRSEIILLGGSDVLDISNQVRKTLDRKPGGVVFFQCGIASPDTHNYVLSWLNYALESSNDTILCPGLHDHICGVDLNGFILEHPFMYPIWRVGGQNTPIEAVALPLLVASGQAKSLLADAILSSWPYSFCPLRLNLRSWRAGIRLICDPEFVLSIDRPAAIGFRQDAPSAAVALLTERLQTWHSLWGREIMLMEAFRLALTDLSAVCSALDALNLKATHLAEEIGSASVENRFRSPASLSIHIQDSSSSKTEKTLRSRRD